MPSRPLVAAVCLGDEIKDLSDEEQRQLRIESELNKDEEVERWEVEVEVGTVNMRGLVHVSWLMRSLCLGIIPSNRKDLDRERRIVKGKDTGPMECRLSRVHSVLPPSR
jgi:hypothetical protein